jgi:general secretion pathway protein I
VKNKRLQAGFSLLEILVAFAVMALSLGVLLRIFAGGTRMAITADEYSRAMVVAESLFASVGMETPIQPGESSGEVDEKYHWTLTVTPYPVDEELSPPGNLPAKPFWVELHVEWGEADEQRSFDLATLRLTQDNGLPESLPRAFPGPRR